MCHLYVSPVCWNTFCVFLGLILVRMILVILGLILVRMILVFLGLILVRMIFVFLGLILVRMILLSSTRKQTTSACVLLCGTDPTPLVHCSSIVKLKHANFSGNFCQSL